MSGTVELFVRVIARETGGAFKVWVDSHSPPLWLPKSVVRGRRYAGERDCTLSVEEWFMEKSRREQEEGCNERRLSEITPDRS